MDTKKSRWTGEPEVLPGEAMAIVVEGTGTTRECDFYFIEVNWS